MCYFKDYTKLAVVLVLVTTSVAHASNKKTNDYAQDLSKCPQHFVKGKPPELVFDKSGKDQYPLCFKGFGVVYSGQSKTAIYSANHLTKDKINEARQLKREDSFRPESRLPRRLQVQNSDYKGQGYDRGHLVPNGDMPNKEHQYDSFSFANIVPQNQEHNRGVWRNIESHTRNLAHKYGEAYVVTGVAFMNKKTQTMNGVAIPSHLYKAVYIPSQNMQAVYFSPNSSVQSYEVIDGNELKNRVGVVPFPAVKNARFDAGEFALDSRDDNSGKANKKPKEEPAAKQEDNQAFWQLIAAIIIAIWKAIAG